MALGLHPGTKPDAPDRRDHRFRPSILRLPQRVDLSRYCGPVFTQRRIHSCSANALASALMLLANRDDAPIRRPSRLFMYYNARALLGQQGADDGTTLRSAVKSVARYGACRETQWPYLVKNVLLKPTRACYDRGDVYEIGYERISRKLQDLRACLAQRDPFIFGIQAYVVPFSKAAKSGYLQLPAAGTKPMGGHALIAVGYDRGRRAFLARNSLGPTYARDGFFWIDERYFADPKLTFDFWRISAADSGS
jgi:C1A family cysteine protease